MELPIALAVLCAFAVVAARWGVDSREPLRSREEEFARLGLTWGPPAASVVRAAGREWVRGRLARLCTALANWLEPDGAPTSDVPVQRLPLSPPLQHTDSML